MRSLGLRFALPVAFAAIGIFACADLGTSASLESGGPSGNGGLSDASAAEGDKNSGSSSGSPDLVPTDNGVIMVHAAGMPAFRLCFKNELDRFPAPDEDTMPDANVVGVEVGSAVRIAPLKGAPGEIYVFNESLIRSYVGGGAKCSALVADPTIFKTAHKMPAIDTDYRTGVHLLVLRGCQGASITTYTKAECGQDYDETKPSGNLSFLDIELKGADRLGKELPTQVLHLSQALEGSRSGAELAVSFGDVTTNDSVHASTAKNPALFGSVPQNLVASPSFDASDDAVYANVGFRVTLKNGTNPPNIVAQQTLADVQKLSAPREIPSTYYAAASNYVLLLLGSPAPKLIDGGADNDPLKKVHLLAVPVIEPKADAGSDGGNTDAGSPDGAL